MMYESYYDKLQPYFARENLQNDYMDCDSFVLSIITLNISNDLKILENLCDFNYLKENHELFSNKNKKVVVKFKNETPKNNWIDEFAALRSKAYSFKCNDKNTNRIKKQFKMSIQTY